MIKERLIIVVRISAYVIVLLMVSLESVQDILCDNVDIKNCISLVKNGGFEEGLNNWYEEHPRLLHGKIAITFDDVKEGKQVLKLSGSDEKVIVGVTSEKIFLKKERNYVVRAWVKSLGKPNKIEIRIRPLDENGTPLNPYQEFNWQFIDVPIDNSWKLIEHPIFMHPKAKGFNITLWLCGEGATLFDAVSVYPVQPEIVPSQAYQLQNISHQMFSVWLESSLVKVYPDSTCPNNYQDAIILSAAGGEYEAIQLVVVPKYNLIAPTILFSDMKGPSTIPKKCLQARYVGYIDVKTQRSFSGRTGLVPDPLNFDPPTHLLSGKAYPVWVSIKVPYNTPPGSYSGNIILHIQGMPNLKMPIKLKVYDFKLPLTPSLSTMARVWKFPEKSRETYLQNLKEHRITGTTDIIQPYFKIQPDNSIIFDWLEFDKSAIIHFQKYGFQEFNIPNIMMGNSDGFFKKDMTWMGIKIGSDKFEKVYSEYIKKFADHLREKGWLKYGLWQIWDEPKLNIKEINLTIKYLGNIIHRVAPDAKVYLTHSISKELNDVVNIWGVPFISKEFNPSEVIEKRRLDDKIWAINNSLFNLDPDNSSLAMRSFLWSLHHYGITGVEWWAITNWHSNPYINPEQFPQKNGGGYFLYPNPKGDGPLVDSIRWESYLDGLEDYDYLELLSQAQEAASKKLKIKDISFSGASLVHSITSLLINGVMNTNKDPAKLIKLREFVAELIPFLKSDPPSVLNFEKTDNHNQIQINGVTKPGVIITINDSPQLLESNGKFSLKCKAGDKFSIKFGKREKHLKITNIFSTTERL